MVVYTCGYGYINAPGNLYKSAFFGTIHIDIEDIDRGDVTNYSSR
jgi:hypothetical protein